VVLHHLSSAEIVITTMEHHPYAHDRIAQSHLDVRQMENPEFNVYAVWRSRGGVKGYVAPGSALEKEMLAAAAGQATGSDAGVAEQVG
jgi:hypothetical protein